MNRKIYLTFAILLPLVAVPRALPQTGSHPSIFYSEDSSGSSYLGVQTEDITPDKVSQLHLKDERGVEVTTIDQDAPASKAGLKEHDVILTVDDQKIESVEQLKRVIRETPAGRSVAIGVSRDGQPVTLHAKLAQREKFDGDNAFRVVVPAVPPINIPAIHIPPINMPDMDFGPIVVIHSLARSGLMLENLTPQLSEFFGVKSGSGVLVRSVERGSRGEQAGFKAGDVIVKINGSDVSDCSDFTRLLRKRADNKASVIVMRERKEQNLTLTLPEARRSGALNEKQACASDDWSDCAENFRNQAAQLASEMQTAEIRKMQPELRNMQKQALQMKPEMKKFQKQIQKDVLDHQEELKKEMEQLREELQKEQKEMQKQVKEWVKNSEI